jgi:hypothetical protein
MKHHAFLLAGLLATAGPTSCPTQVVQTVVHEDGSVDRAIVQNLELTPEAARRPPLWLESRVVASGPDDPWDGSIASLPLRTDGQQGNLFAARGHFASVAAVPDHYAELTPDGAAASRLTRTYSERDLGLVIERTWTETLSDVTTLAEMAKAREALSQIEMKLLRGALDSGLGRDYDYDEYVRWVGDTYKTYFAVVAEAGLEARAANIQDLSDAAARPLVDDIAARYGAPWAFGEKDDETKAFILERTQRLITRRDGRPVDRATTDLIAAAVFNVVVEFGESDAGAPFKAGLDRVAASDYGGAEALKTLTETLGVRMLGLTYAHSGRPYTFSLAIPGTIVETNGTLEDNARARWDFKLEAAYLFGYTMRCRSLRPNAEPQRAALGSVRLTSREAMLRYVALVDGDEALLGVVRQAIAEKRAAPVAAYQAKLAADKQQADRAAKVAKLMAVLGITVK